MLILPLLLVVAWHSTETTTAAASSSFIAMFAASAQIMMARRRTSQYDCLRRWASLPHDGSNSVAIVVNDCVNEEGVLPDARLFFRFSPLIGGPSFLPLHVEVIVVVLDEYGNNFGSSHDGRHCINDLASSKRRLWSNAIHFAMVDDDSSSSSIEEYISTTTDYYAQENIDLITYQ